MPGSEQGTGFEVTIIPHGLPTHFSTILTVYLNIISTEVAATFPFNEECKGLTFYYEKRDNRNRRK